MTFPVCDLSRSHRCNRAASGTIDRRTSAGSPQGPRALAGHSRGHRSPSPISRGLEDFQDASQSTNGAPAAAPQAEAMTLPPGTTPTISRTRPLSLSPPLPRMNSRPRRRDHHRHAATKPGPRRNKLRCRRQPPHHSAVSTAIGSACRRTALARTTSRPFPKTTLFPSIPTPLTVSKWCAAPPRSLRLAGHRRRRRAENERIPTFRADRRRQRRNPRRRHERGRGKRRRVQGYGRRAERHRRSRRRLCAASRRLRNAARARAELIRRQPGRRSRSVARPWNDGFVGVAFTHIESLYGIPGDEAREGVMPRIDMEQQKVLARGEWRVRDFGLEAVRFWFGASDYAHNELAIHDPDVSNPLSRSAPASRLRSRRRASSCSMCR